MASQNKRRLPSGNGGRRPDEGLKSTNIPYKVVTLESWAEYLSFISDSPYQNWAFRGQRDASAPLFSALSRHFMAFRVDQRAWREQEQRTLRILTPKRVHFLHHNPRPTD